MNCSPHCHQYPVCEERGAFTVSNTLVGRGDLFIHSHSRLLVKRIIFTYVAFKIWLISLMLFIMQETKGLCLSIREMSRSEFFSPYFPTIYYRPNKISKNISIANYVYSHVLPIWNSWILPETRNHWCYYSLKSVWVVNNKQNILASSEHCIVEKDY